jgi:hypothetical protein
MKTFRMSALLNENTAEEAPMLRAWYRQGRSIKSSAVA